MLRPRRSPSPYYRLEMPNGRALRPRLSYRLQYGPRDTASSANLRSEVIMICPTCGTQIDGQGKFCAVCGARLPEAESTPPSNDISAAPPPPAPEPTQIGR